jgi:tetratricopeptide (TPR) repeat protein
LKGGYQYILQVFLLIFLGCSHSWGQTQEDLDVKIKQAVELLQNKEHEKSLEILLEVRHVASKNGWEKERFLAYNNIGLNYYMMVDYGEALENYLEAYKIALKSLESKHEVIVLNNIAVIYIKEEDFKKADEYISKAYDIAVKNNDNKKIAMYSINLASIATEVQNINRAETFVNKALSILDPTSIYYLPAQHIKAKVQYLKGDYMGAKAILDKLIPQFDDRTQIDEKGSSLVLMTETLMALNQYEEALKYAKEFLYHLNISVDDRYEAYKLMSKFYVETKDFEKANLYKDSMLMTKDSLNLIKNGNLYETNRIKFELQSKENQLALSKSQIKKERKIFIFTIGLLIILLFISLWAIKNYFGKLKQKKIIAENNQRIAELELEKQKSDKIMLEQKFKEQEQENLLNLEKYKNEIEQKNRQLAVKALSNSSKNEMLENILEHLNLYKELKENPTLSKLIKELKSHVKTDGNWDEFFTHFEEVNQGFVKNLKQKHPELNTNDLRFISYFYMNLTIKEIATLLNITVEACRKRKERIGQKMGLLPEMDLYDHISNLS